MIHQEIPEIEIGEYNDILDPSIRMDPQKVTDDPLSEKELQQISADIAEQYSQVIYFLFLPMPLAGT